MICVRELCKSFGDNQVLRGITETVEKGEVVVVIGPSGSGKSTFLRCLNLLEQPTSGQIFFDGEEITAKKVKIDQVREKMGMVFQQFGLFSGRKVLENITLAPIQVKKQKPAEAKKTGTGAAGTGGSGR